ncbi:TPA: hypothetical protein ACKJ60_001907, partial [Neisseria gonorrhoeae]
ARWYGRWARIELPTESLQPNGQLSVDGRIGGSVGIPPIFYISGGRGKFLPFCLREGGVIQNY